MIPTGFESERAEYLRLLEHGHLTPSQATELARLSQASQPNLFTMIREGRCGTYAKLRAAADGIVAAESQSAVFADLPQSTAAEAAALTAFERKLDQIVQLVSSGFKDNEIVVFRHIKPARAATIVVELGLVRKHQAMLEREVQMVGSSKGELMAGFSMTIWLIRARPWIPFPTPSPRARVFQRAAL